MNIHYIRHNFSDWDSQTKHMSRIEKSIFLDLRTMYFGNATKANGNIDGNDFELLCYRLSCHSEEEINALKQLLKDKFKKVGKVYRNADWDKQIKSLDWWYQNQGNDGNAQGNETGSGGNDSGNAQGNAMSNAERTAKAKAERKNIIATLAKSNIPFDRNAPIATLRALLPNDSNAQSVTQETVSGNETGNGGNDGGNAQGNDGNAEIHANNHKPITINQEPETNTQTPPNPQDQKSGVCDGETAEDVLAKAEKICQANAQDIENWVAPSIDEMRGMLITSGFSGTLTDQQYTQLTSDMKIHFAEQAILGKPIVTDSLRKNKLRDWIMRNASKPLAKTKPAPYGGANDPLAVNHKFRPNDTGMVAPNTIFETDEHGNFVARPIEPVQQPTVEAW